MKVKMMKVGKRTYLDLRLYTTKVTLQSHRSDYTWSRHSVISWNRLISWQSIEASLRYVTSLPAT